MTQHENPLERTPSQPGTEADAQTHPAGTSIGDAAGVFSETAQSARPGADDTASSGMDQARDAALEKARSDDSATAPPADYRPDAVVRATGAEARVEMERGNDFRNEANFTKGHNAPTMDRSRNNYSVQDMDEYLTEARRGIFPDTPGGAGARTLSAERPAFINEVARRGHFPSRQEAEKWSRAVFNALRQRAVETDDAIAAEFATLVRVGESPSVQVEEMMWSGDFVERFSRLVCVLQNWNKDEFYQQVAEEAGETTDDPWIDAAVFSFFGALKNSLNDDAEYCKVGELQDVWDRA